MTERGTCAVFPRSMVFVDTDVVRGSVPARPNQIQQLLYAPRMVSPLMISYNQSKLGPDPEIEAAFVEHATKCYAFYSIRFGFFCSFGGGPMANMAPDRGWPRRIGGQVLQWKPPCVAHLRHLKLSVRGG